MPSRGLLRDCTTGCGTDGSICGTNRGLAAHQRLMDLNRSVAAGWKFYAYTMFNLSSIWMPGMTFPSLSFLWRGKLFCQDFKEIKDMNSAKSVRSHSARGTRRGVFRGYLFRFNCSLPFREGVPCFSQE